MYRIDQMLSDSSVQNCWQQPMCHLVLGESIIYKIQRYLCQTNHQFSVLQIIHDINCLMEEVCGDYLGHVLAVLKSCSSEVLDLVKQSILQGGNSLRVLQPLVISSIVETLVEKSVEVSHLSSFISI